MAAPAGVAGIGLDVPESALEGRQVVVACGMDGAALAALGAACRARGVALVACGAPGLLSWCFVDGGEEVPVEDADGEDPKSGLVVGVRRGEAASDGKGEGTGKGEGKSEGAGLVLELDPDVRHGLEKGDALTLSGLEGPAVAALNGGADTGPVLEVRAVPSPHAVDVGPEALARWAEAEAAAGCSAGAGYTRGGYFQQVKQATTVRHKAASEFFGSIGAEGAGPCPEAEGHLDVRRWGRPTQLLALLRALWAARWKASTGGAEAGEGGRPLDPECAGWPAAGDAEAAGAIARAAAASLGEGGAPSSADVSALTRAAGTAVGRLSPCCTAAGAVAGQEAIKLVTRRFTPLSQWWLYDATSALPQLPSAEEAGPTGDRYDGQVAVFGRGFQAQLEAARVFLVGSGALGCEFLKAFALMGVGAGGPLGEGETLRAGPEGARLDRAGVLVTDMDRIERSNLSRQFLFRDRHIGQPKSTAAAQAAQEINPSLTVEPLETMVAPHTETVLPHDFWRSLSVVVNALDNVKARRYVDD